MSHAGSRPMHATDFGRTLIIANPAAQSGAAREVAERLQRFLDMTARASQFDLVLTERMGHAKELAAQAQGYRTVIALGGDGVIHEVVNGLMTAKGGRPPRSLPSCPWLRQRILPRRSASTISPARILARAHLRAAASGYRAHSLVEPCERQRRGDRRVLRPDALRRY